MAVLSLPILEVVALVVVGGALGVFRTIALFVLLSLAGLYVFRARVAQLATRSLAQTSDTGQMTRTIGSAVLAVFRGAPF